MHTSGIHNVVDEDIACALLTVLNRLYKYWCKRFDHILLKTFTGLMVLTSNIASYIYFTLFIVLTCNIFFFLNIFALSFCLEQPAQTYFILFFFVWLKKLPFYVFQLFCYYCYYYYYKLSTTCLTTMQILFYIKFSFYNEK